MPDEIWKEMCSMVRESMPSCDYFVCTPECCFAEDGGSRMFHWLRDSYGYDIREVPEMLKLKDQQIIKFSVYHQNACEEMCAPLFTPAWKDKTVMAAAGQRMDGLYSHRFRKRTCACLSAEISRNLP